MTKFRVAAGLALALCALRADAPDLRLIDLNVIAVDKGGQPITDLTAADFEVTDAGKPRAIAFFHHQDDSLWQAPKLAPHEFSNRSSAGIPHATVILFDLMNESFSTRGTAANQIVHALERLENADDLYLYLLTVEGRLFAVHGLTTEDAAQPGAPPWTKKIKPLLDQAQRAVLKERPTEIDVAARVQLTFAALDALGVQLSIVAGRKNVLWVTDGVPVELGPVRSDTGDFVDFTPQMRQLSEALVRSRIALYPVRQVLIGSPDRIGSASDGIGETGGEGTGIQSTTTLDNLADMTGGRRSQGKDVASALKQAMNDVRVSYQLGYYAPENNWDGKYHKLRVTCKRKGVRIQAKTGYFAWAEPPGTASAQAIQAVAGAPADASEIGLRATLGDSAIQHELVLNAHIDANSIAFGQIDGHYDGRLSVALAVYLADGRMESSKIEPLNLNYTAAQRDTALKDGIAFSRNFPIAGNFRTVRFIVYDRGSNAIGSLTIPVNQPH